MKRSDWSGSTAVAQTPVAEVYGTPGDGKVPTWSMAHGRLEWATPTGGSTPVVGEYAATAVLADFVGGNRAVLSVTRQTAGIDVDGTNRILPTVAGMYLLTLFFETGYDNDKAVYIETSAGDCIAEVTAYDAGGTSTEDAMASQIYAINPGDALVLTWGYPDVEPTAGTGSVVVKVTRLGDLPTFV